MALGMIEQCLELCVQYAKDRVQFGQPIGEFQLIQDKLARMEVARLNVQNLVFRYVEMSAAGVGSLAEASAMAYSARAAVEVTMEAVQLFGGNGYMSEYQVEQLARDSKVLQIYAGTDEIQITHIAKDLLREAADGPRFRQPDGGSGVRRDEEHEAGEDDGRRHEAATAQRLVQDEPAQQGPDHHRRLAQHRHVADGGEAHGDQDHRVGDERGRACRRGGGASRRSSPTRPRRLGRARFPRVMAIPDAVAEARP